MDPVHVHLLLNHAVILGIPFGLVLLVAGLLRRSDEVKRIALWTLVVAATLSVPVFLSGSRAEETVESMPGVPESVLEAHEEAGKVAWLATSVVGLLAALGLALSRRRPVHSWVVAALLILGGGTAGMLARTANLGGQIRHAEIRDATTGVTAEMPERSD